MTRLTLDEPRTQASNSRAASRSGEKFYWPVVLVTILFVLANISWSFFDRGWPDWDAAGHVLNGLTYRDLLKHPHVLAPEWWHQFLSVNYLYPPAVYIFSGFIKLFAGTGTWVDGLIKAIYEALLCIGVYKVGKLALKDKLAALMAVVIVNLYPLNSVLSHQMMLDFPTLTMVALGLWSLIAWNDKPSIKNTIVLGVVIGLACMSKQLCGAFLLPPAALIFLSTLIKRDFKGVAKLIGAAVIPAAMALPWLLVTYPALQKLAAYNTSAMGAKGLALDLGWVFSYYMQEMPSIMSPILLMAFFTSILLATPKTHRNLILVTASSLGGLLLISSLSWAYPLDRYAMPSLIAPAIYTGNAFACAWSNKSSWLLRFAFATLILTASLQFLIFNYAPYPIPTPSVLNRALSVLGVGLTAHRTEALPANPEAKDWGQEWAIEQIKQVDHDLPVYLNVMPNHYQLNVHTLQYVGKLAKSNVIPTTQRQWSVTGDSIEFSPQKALYYHWYLLKTGYQGNRFQQAEYQNAFDAITTFVQTSKKFRLVASRSLPDRTILLLFRQK